LSILIFPETKEVEEATQKFVQTPSENFQSYKPILEEPEETEYTFIILAMTYH